MRSPPLVRQVLAAGGFFALGVVAGCTDSGPTDPLLAGPSVPLAAADVVLPGTDAGAFAHSILANESGWSTTEFWDNESGDGSHCNIGYYATGAMGTCTNEAPGSDANQGGYTKYWGNGPENRQAASFMFSGDYVYKVTFVGHYSAEDSEVGWFTVSGGVYTFHTLWATESVNAFALIPAGTDWGIYMKHTGHVGASCAADMDCSDAMGEIHGGTPPIQQFALFTNAKENKYLVGVEDAEQENIVGDDDYNDVMLSVEPFDGMFVIGDVEDHDINDPVYFWGAQWWKNNFMSGIVGKGVASFKGYADNADVTCGGVWSTLPGNSSVPPAVIPDHVLIIVTSKVLKVGPAIGGDIREILMVHHDGSYGPSPGHPGRGPVTDVVCELEN